MNGLERGQWLSTDDTGMKTVHYMWDISMFRKILDDTKYFPKSGKVTMKLHVVMYIDLADVRNLSMALPDTVGNRVKRSLVTDELGNVVDERSFRDNTIHASDHSGAGPDEM